MDIVLKSLKALEFDKILEKLANFAKIEQSKSLCFELLPFQDIVKINKELRCTREAKFILDMPNDIPIEFVANIKRLTQNSSYFAEDELIDIAKTLKTSRLVKKFLSDNIFSLEVLTVDGHEKRGEYVSSH